MDHRFVHLPTSLSLDVVDVPSLSPNVALTARVHEAYRRSIADFGSAARGGLWDVLAQIYQSDFLAALGSSTDSLDTYLAGMFKRSATHGTCQGAVEYETLRAPEARRLHGLLTYDKLTSLAEAVGVRPLSNPEQVIAGTELDAGVDTIVASISAAIGRSIVPPPVDGGLVKLKTRYGLLHERDLHSLLTAWSIVQLLGPNVRICEIGGGVGKGAYWSTQLGSPSAPYVILDLPHIAATQGYYLGRTGLTVAMYGEPADKVQVHVLPFHRRDQLVGSFDVVLNQDSFPELGLEDALGYLRWMRRSKVSYFYSVNHESKPPALTVSGTLVPQHKVSELCAQVGGFSRILRAPYWLRRGYAVEVYRVAPEAR